MESARNSLHQYLEEVTAYHPLSAREEIVLAARMKEGDLEARDRLVRASLRFVISIAREYKHYGMPLEDLISSGNLGLIRAAERFGGG